MSQGFSLIEGEYNHVDNGGIKEDNQQAHQYLSKQSAVFFHADYTSSFPPLLRTSIFFTNIIISIMLAAIIN